MRCRCGGICDSMERSCRLLAEDCRQTWNLVLTRHEILTRANIASICWQLGIETCSRIVS